MNLIGEHIDYCGYSVLPMAIEQNVKILAAPSGSSSIVIKSDVQVRLKRDGNDPIIPSSSVYIAVFV